MADYPPYVDAYGSISKLFDAIIKAAVPPKFTHDFINTILGLKSTSYRAMIPLLKRLGFIDQANVPTEAYKKYRDETLSRSVMAAQIKSAYADLYKAHEYAQKLGPAELQGKLRTILGLGEDDATVPKVAGTFSALAKLADFESKGTPPVIEDKSPNAGGVQGARLPDGLEEHRGKTAKFGLSYTINLNLPATTEVEVFNAIFKSLREHILE
jgi:hypothetical protein